MLIALCWQAAVGLIQPFPQYFTKNPYAFCPPTYFLAHSKVHVYTHLHEQWRTFTSSVKTINTLPTDAKYSKPDI